MYCFTILTSHSYLLWKAGDDDVRFQRIDADLTEAFKEETGEEALKERQRL